MNKGKEFLGLLSLFLIVLVGFVVQTQLLSSFTPVGNLSSRAAITQISQEDFYNSFVESLGTPPQDRSYLNNGSFSVFVTNFHQHIPEDAVPLPEQIIGRGAELSEFATLDDYAPLTFSVYADAQLTNLTAGIESGLRQQEGNGFIGPEKMDLRIVKRLNMKLQGTDRVENVGEYLDFISPISLERGKVQQYWLTVRVEDNVPEGNYQGSLYVEANINGQISRQSFPVKLKVYPVLLRDNPDRYFGLYFNISTGYTYQGQTINIPLSGSNLTKWDYIKEGYYDLRAHGIRVVIGSQRPRVSGSGTGGISFNYADFKTDLGYRVEYGLDKVIIAPDLYDEILAITGNSTSAAELYYRRAINETAAAVEEKTSAPYYFYPVDEAHLEGRADKFKNLARIIKEEGKKVYLTSIQSFFDRDDIDGPNAQPPLVDLRNYNSRDINHGLDFTLLSNEDWTNFRTTLPSSDLIWTYYNCRAAGGRAEYYRVINGFWFWLKPFSAQGAWTYQNLAGKELFSSDPEKNGFAFTYPDPKNNFLPRLPSLRWEGYREGIEDYKYIYTLEKTLEEARTNGVSPERIAYAEAVLNQLRTDVERYGPKASSLARQFNYDYYQNARRNILEAILILTGRMPLPEPTPTPTLTPTPTSTPTPTPFPLACPLSVRQEKGDTKTSLTSGGSYVSFVASQTGWVDKIEVKVGNYGGAQRSVSCKVTSIDGTEVSSLVSSSPFTSASGTAWRALNFKNNRFVLFRNYTYRLYCYGPDSWGSLYWIWDAGIGEKQGKTYRIYLCPDENATPPTPTPTPPPLPACPLSMRQEKGDTKASLSLTGDYVSFVASQTGWVDKIEVKVGNYGGAQRSVSCKVTNADGEFDISTLVSSLSFTSASGTDWRVLDFKSNRFFLFKDRHYRLYCYGPDSWGSLYWIWDAGIGGLAGKTYRIYLCPAGE